MFGVECNDERIVIGGLPVSLGHDDDLFVLATIKRLRHAEHRLSDDVSRRRPDYSLHNTRNRLFRFVGVKIVRYLQPLKPLLIRPLIRIRRRFDVVHLDHSSGVELPRFLGHELISDYATFAVA